MKGWTITALALLFAVLTACTPTIYGVPQERWSAMSESEHLEAMRIYEARQLAARQAAAERARLRAIEAERQAAREAEETRLQRLRVEAIYRGEGSYGDLLRVTIRGATMEIAGKRRTCRPLAFKIADGESKEIVAVSADGHRGRLHVSYHEGTLVIDDHGKGRRSRGSRLIYDRDWGRGKSYRDLRSEGALRLRGAEVYVEIADRSAPVRRPRVRR